MNYRIYDTGQFIPARSLRTRYLACGPALLTEADLAHSCHVINVTSRGGEITSRELVWLKAGVCKLVVTQLTAVN